eukprot:357723-Chlamydomonas_euryale.AAC.6
MQPHGISTGGRVHVAPQRQADRERLDGGIGDRVGQADRERLRGSLHTTTCICYCTATPQSGPLPRQLLNGAGMQHAQQPMPCPTACTDLDVVLAPTVVRPQPLLHPCPSPLLHLSRRLPPACAPASPGGHPCTTTPRRRRAACASARRCGPLLREAAAAAPPRCRSVGIPAAAPSLWRAPAQRVWG